MRESGLFSQVFRIDVDRLQEVGVTDDKKDKIFFANIGNALVGVGGNANDIAGMNFGRWVITDFDQAGS